jgi:hypothetical protein
MFRLKPAEELFAFAAALPPLSPETMAAVKAGYDERLRPLVRQPPLHIWGSSFMSMLIAFGSGRTSSMGSPMPRPTNVSMNRYHVLRAVSRSEKQTSTGSVIPSSWRPPSR